MEEEVKTGIIIWSGGDFEYKVRGQGGFA